MFHLSINEIKGAVKAQEQRRRGPRGRWRGGPSISCKRLCVSRVFGSYFKFRQKGAERLPGERSSAGTDPAPCLSHTETACSAAHCRPVPSAAAMKRAVCGPDQSLLLFILPLLLRPSPRPETPPSPSSSARHGTAVCQEPKRTIAADVAGGTKPVWPTWLRFSDRHAPTVTFQRLD